MEQERLRVEEFTTPNPITATENTSVEEMVQLMKENGIRHLPITRGEQVVGIISDRDLKVAMGLNAQERRLIRAADIMVCEPVTVRSETTIDEVALEMSKNKIGSVIVNDSDDNFFGIFTATDALNALVEVVRGSKTDQ
jgi:acetoin utilization protein AcuB